MTIKRVTLSGLFCDAEGCSSSLPVESPDATSARLRAARDGWSYATFVKVNERGGHGMARADYCPEHAHLTTDQANGSPDA